MVFLWSFFMNIAVSKTITLGFSPITFPRDPVNFNQYTEHALIGQILKPLIETDIEGNLVAGISDHWKISKDGLKIVFKIENKKFSNGTPVTGDDVKYTFERNIKLKSQSSEYLKSIYEIIADKNSVTLTLKYRDPAILKALSRDQLGIVPKNWEFDQTSASPYIGSGDYNLKKIKNSWFLIRNEKENSNSFDFKLLYYKNEKYEITDEDQPDVSQFININTLSSLKKNKTLSSYQEMEIPSFVQSLFWVTKQSSLYTDEKLRIRVRAALEEALQVYFTKNNSIPATGIIPIGIPGALENREVSNFKIDSALSSIKVNLYYISGSHDNFINSSELKATILKYNINLVMKPYSVSESPSNHKDADIIATSFAGGFNDPMGFIGILYKIFGIPFEDYLPSDFKTYFTDAKDENDWKKRTLLFKQLNAKIVKSSLCIPGWKSRMYSLVRPNISNEKTLFRYTPRLINYSSKENK